MKKKAVLLVTLETEVLFEMAVALFLKNFRLISVPQLPSVMPLKFTYKFLHILHSLNKYVKRGINKLLKLRTHSWTGWRTAVLHKLLIFPLKSKANQFISFLCPVQTKWGSCFACGPHSLFHVNFIINYIFDIENLNTYPLYEMLTYSLAFCMRFKNMNSALRYRCSKYNFLGKSVIFIIIIHDALIFAAKWRGFGSSAVINNILCGPNP